VPVAALVRIGELAAREAHDLVEALAVRGLIGRVVEEGGSARVEVTDAREDPDRLAAEVAEATGRWLADRGGASLELEVGGRRTTVTPSADLGDALRGRLEGRQRGLRRRA
jgi:hypothetical protein